MGPYHCLETQKRCALWHCVGFLGRKAGAQSLCSGFSVLQLTPHSSERRKPPLQGRETVEVLAADPKRDGVGAEG